MLYLTVLICFVFFAAVAMTIGEGLWSNTIALFSVILSSLLAVFGGVPLGVWILEKSGRDDTFSWIFVFTAMWVVFTVTVVIFRVLSERISRVRMKFVPPLEMVSGPLMGIFVAVMFTSFAAYTLERVPIKAGEWDFASAAGWQQSAFKYARLPFLSVVVKCAEAEGVDTEFIAK